MQELLLETVRLLRKWPVLWLPYVAAELLAIAIWRARGSIDHAIITWISTTKSTSVLGGIQTTERFDPYTLHHAFIATLPINFGAQFFCVLLFVFALLITARLLGAILEGRKPSVVNALGSPTPRWRSLFVVSLLFLISFEMLSAGFLLLISYLLTQTNHSDWMKSLPILLLELATVTWVTSWLLVPMSVRLLEPTEAALGPSVRLRGSILALLAVEISTALGTVLQKIEAKAVIESSAQMNLLITVNKVLANSPVALLFVALAFLAHQAAIPEGEVASRPIGTEATE